MLVENLNLSNTFLLWLICKCWHANMQNKDGEHGHYHCAHHRMLMLARSLKLSLAFRLETMIVTFLVLPVRFPSRVLSNFKVDLPTVYQTLDLIYSSLAVEYSCMVVIVSKVSCHKVRFHLTRLMMNWRVSQPELKILCSLVVKLNRFHNLTCMVKVWCLHFNALTKVGISFFFFFFR